MTLPHRNPDIRPSLLLVDDDIALRKVLARALEGRGFQVQVAQRAKAASQLITDNPPQYAVIALKLPAAPRLKLVSMLHAHISHMLNKKKGNISATARALSMDRRTLQRELRKRPPGD